MCNKIAAFFPGHLDGEGMGVPILIYRKDKKPVAIPARLRYNTPEKYEQRLRRRKGVGKAPGLNKGMG